MSIASNISFLILLGKRLKKLEEKGIIEGYYAKLNKKFFGYDLMAFITVYMKSSKKFHDLEDHVSQTREILECHAILGEGSHLLKVVIRGTEDLEKLLAQIQSWPGVSRTVTSFVLSTVKETTTINI